jgi:hypothetical protein
MKYILILISILTFSCSNQNQEEAGKVEEQDKMDDQLPPPPPLSKIDLNNESCRSELEKAKSDAKKGFLVYTQYGRKFKRYDEELEEVLKKFNIAYKPLGPNCTGELNCYGLFMDSLITEKYGKAFITSLSKIADHMFESRWATKTYKYWDLKVGPSYRNVSPDTFILRNINFPKGWDFEPVEDLNEVIDTEFIVDSAGKVSNIKAAVILVNLKNANKKHLSYLKKEVERVIKEMEPWKPAELNGHKVKCWYHLEIYLNKNNLPQQNL